MLRALQQFAFQSTYYTEQNLYPSPLVRPCQGGSHVARLNFKTSCVSVYKCLSLIVGFALTVPICWPREVVSCHDFILHTVATFWAMSLVGIYPGRASLVWLGSLGWRMVYRHFKKVTYPWQNWDKKIMVKAIMYIVVLYIYSNGICWIFQWSIYLCIRHLWCIKCLKKYMNESWVRPCGHKHLFHTQGYYRVCFYSCQLTLIRMSIIKLNTGYRLPH